MRAGNNYCRTEFDHGRGHRAIIRTLCGGAVKRQSNTYDAEMARTGGGMFNTYLKSGANEWHGSLFGTLRQTSWAANNFFNNAAGIALPEQPNRTFGASFGGPVSIPKVYKGKNRTFFWLAWEGYQDTQSNTSQFSTPTALERIGDFSQSKTSSGALNVIYDPKSTVCAGSTCTRQPFAGNIIPTDRLNPVGLAIAATYVAADGLRHSTARRTRRRSRRWHRKPRRRRRNWITSSLTGGAAV